MNLEMQIEAVLFYKSEPVKKKFLIDFFAITEDDFNTAITTLREQLKQRALALTETDTHVQLVTSSEVSQLIETLRKDDLKSDIGKAGAETLAIILYRGPLSRVEIDSIRGVNSTFVIRNLLIRGLIERRNHSTDVRSFQYAVTPALLNELGVSRKEDLPDFETVLNTLESYESEENTPENKVAESVTE